MRAFTDRTAEREEILDVLEKMAPQHLYPYEITALCPKIPHIVVLNTLGSLRSMRAVCWEHSRTTRGYKYFHKSNRKKSHHAARPRSNGAGMVEEKKTYTVFGHELNVVQAKALHAELGKHLDS